MTGFSVAPYRVLVQKSRGRGFDGQFFDDEKAAAMQLLWEHLVNADDPQAALTSLRAELESHLADFSREWLEPQPADQGDEL